MNPEKKTESPQKKQPAGHRAPPLVAYLIILFSVAFLLLFLSYFMQQRKSDQDVIEGLQQSTSAMQSVHTLISQNETLRDQLTQIEENYADLELQLQTLQETQQAAQQAAQQKEQELQAAQEAQNSTTLALDWLWRIEREYFQHRYSSARNLIKEFESSGLKDYLPTTSLVDPDYRSPMEQYQAMYDRLF